MLSWGASGVTPYDPQQQIDDPNETFDITTTNQTDVGNDNNSFIASDSLSEGLLTGNYRLTAISTSQISPLYECSVIPGVVTVYNGQITGFVDGFYDVTGTVTSSGQVTGSATSSGTLISSLSGQLSSQGGSGTWRQAGLCSGNWNMQRMDFGQPGGGRIFTLPDDQFPAALRIRFTPKESFSKNAVACTRSIGIVYTNGYIGSSDKELNYRGYTETTAGYRLDIDFSIDTSSGEVNGSYRYDPLGISGDFDGDAYFAGTSRTYTSRTSSYDNGCQGRWEMTVVDIPF